MLNFSNYRTNREFSLSNNNITQLTNMISDLDNSTEILFFLNSRFVSKNLSIVEICKYEERRRCRKYSFLRNEKNNCQTNHCTPKFEIFNKIIEIRIKTRCLKKSIEIAERNKSCKKI